MDYTLSHAAVSVVATSALSAVSVKFFTDYIGYVFIALLFIFALKKAKKYLPLFIQAGTAVLLSRGIITEAIRFFWKRERPLFPALQIFPPSGEPSFPSGHAAVYFALATVLYAYNKKLGIFAFAVAIVIGVARVFAGFHWPSDIVGGALIGIASGFLVAKLFSKIKEP